MDTLKINKISIKDIQISSGPACFTFDVKILFDNSDHDGQIVISLNTQPHQIACPDGYQVLGHLQVSMGPRGQVQEFFFEMYPHSLALLQCFQ